MVIDKVIGNNLVRSFDERGKEILIMGCGIGFNKKAGQEVEADKVEKIYAIEDKQHSNKLMTLLSGIPLEHIQASNEIISYAKASLGKKLSDNIYISLTDHISFAIQRHEQGLDFKNALLWEIKRFYNHEFLIGKEAVSIIKRRLGIELSEDEAASIALHIVNAELNFSNMDETVQITKMINDIIKIIKYNYRMELDEYSLHYERFITHLKFFAKRLFSGKNMHEEDEDFYIMMRKKYQAVYACTEKIRDYIRKEYGHELSEEEMLYLSVHIKRITEEVS